MENIPKIVRARLARAAAEEHPDADLLTGFAEQALGDTERQLVMAHLSRCGDCREVVALALPSNEAAPSAAGPEAGAWFTWPALRWAAVAAGALLVTSVGILRYEKSAHEQPALVSMQLQNENKQKKEDKQKEDKAAVLQRPEPLVPPSAQLTVPQPEKAAKQAPAQRLSHPQNSIAANQSATQLNGLFSIAPPTNKASSGMGSGNGSGSGGGIGGAVYRPREEANNNGPTTNYQEQAKTGSLALAPVAKTPLPATSDAQVSKQDQALSGGLVAQNQPDLSPDDQHNLDVVKAKDSVTQQSGPREVAAPTAPSLAPLAGLGASVRWTISSGVLQRSLNGGATWQDVNVDTTEAFKSQRKSSARMEDYRYKKNETPAIFRAVAASGSEVWAGGSGGMLVHSLDAGNHWAQVVPSEAKIALTGDIVAVELSDAQHGKITTSAGEVWTTSDDGQTWHKQ